MELPHPAAPFVIERKGTQTVEQGSEANRAGNVYNVAVCPLGFREDLPEFGIPTTVNKPYPVDESSLEEALQRWEPEASLQLEQQRIAIGEAGISIAV